jgi:hypothetical protein
MFLETTQVLRIPRLGHPGCQSWIQRCTEWPHFLPWQPGRFAYDGQAEHVLNH